MTEQLRGMPMPNSTHTPGVEGTVSVELSREEAEAVSHALPYPGSSPYVSDEDAKTLLGVRLRVANALSPQPHVPTAIGKLLDEGDCERCGGSGKVDR